ncbi:MAG: LysE family translocator [Tidjanibacter sp.]|nr:LysE family translocator [Tidjanibacter sp.]
MWINVLIGGLMVGVMASVPPGPTCILTIQRNLSKGMRSGLLTGLGVATCDTLYSSIAFFSLAMVMSFVESHMLLIKGIAGFCITFFGVNIFLTNPAVQIRRNRNQAGKGGWQDYISGFLLGLSNPTYILAHVALIATVQAMGFSNPEGTVISNALMIIGVMGGCMAWWTLIAVLMKLVRKNFRPRHMLWINRIAGTIITLIGLSLIASMISDLNINIHLDDLFPHR